MDIGMDIEPHHAKALIGMGPADAGNGGSRCGVIPCDHDREQPSLKGGSHQSSRIRHHNSDRLDMKGMWGRGVRAQLRCPRAQPGLRLNLLNQAIADLAQILLAGSRLLEQIDARPAPGTPAPRSQSTSTRATLGRLEAPTYCAKVFFSRFRSASDNTIAASASSS